MEDNRPQAPTDLPLIGITTGDYNGIGPEIILKLVEDTRITKYFIPVIYGSHKVLNRYRKLFAMEEVQFFLVKQPNQAHAKRINVRNCWDKDIELSPGKPTPESGQFALACLNAAVEDLKSGQIKAIVTAPIHKANMPEDGFNFPGHTEYFAYHFGGKRPLMLLKGERMKVATLTTHIALDEVPNTITEQRIHEAIDILDDALKKYFGAIKPKIAVLGLNPHAGEEGKIGLQEKNIIIPAIQKLKDKGRLIFGPYPADAFFGAHHYTKFDAVLGMYHDQVLIPFKMAEFDTGVNVTLGIDAIRTSPDHGTAFDIAGKNIASEHSLRQACFTALDMLKERFDT
jgi:4-hydroxythreonine-4-phosphate dehydrogenase